MASAREVPTAPTPEDTLRLLEQFRGVLWLDNPCTARPGRCIHLAPDAPKFFPRQTRASLVEHLESQYYLETSTIPSILSVEEFDAIVRDSELRPSDSYVCHGSTSQGSGRTVTKGVHQIKGVGRTLHATWHFFYRDMCGVLSLLDATAEAFIAHRLRGVLTTPPLPLDFILVPGFDSPAVHIARKRVTTPDVRCVMGRRGSPLRLGHLEYLSSALRAVREENVGSYLVHLLLSHDGGVPARGIDTRVMSMFTTLMRRAIRAAAESRVYGLVFSWWPDNFDLFCRAFDVAETQFYFPHALTDGAAPLPLPTPDETPHAYLTRLSIHADHKRSFALYPLRNILSAIHLVGREIDWPRARLDERFTWAWIERYYRADVRYAVGRVLGAPASDARVRDVARHFPLIGGDDVSFDWDAYLDALPRAVVKRGAEFRALIRGSVVRDELSAFHATVKRDVATPYLERGFDSVPRLALRF